VQEDFALRGRGLLGSYIISSFQEKLRRSSKTLARVTASGQDLNWKNLKLPATLKMQAALSR
jgi:hypothetical protein